MKNLLPFAACFCALIHAAELPPIVVTASRTGKTPGEMPDSVQVVTAGEIARSGVTDTVQAVERLGQVYLRNALGAPTEAAIALRGLGDNSQTRVLILVNGRRLNNPDMKAANLLAVPVASIERIEIIRGNQTVLHGGMAEAGVINIITKEPAGETGGEITVSAGSDASFLFSATLAGPLTGAASYALSLGRQSSDGWRQHSDYDIYNARADLLLTPSDRLDVALGFDYLNAAYAMPGALTLAQFRANPVYSDPARRHDQYRSETYGADGSLTGAFRNAAELSLDWRLTRRDATYDFNTGYAPALLIERTDQTLDTLQLNPKLFLPFTLAGHRNELTLGIDFTYDRLRTAKANRATRRILARGDLDQTTLAAYIRNEFFLTGSLSLAAGFRAEKQRLTGPVWADTYSGRLSSDAASSHHGLAYDLSLLWRPADSLKLYLKAGMLYHAPALDEQAFYTGYAPVGVNPNLDPEWGASFETGLAWRLAKEWEATLALYCNDIRDGISYNALTLVNDNLDRTRTLGAEAALAWQRQGLGLLKAACEYARPRFADGANDGATVPLVPACIFSLYGELDLPAGFTLTGAARAVSDQYYSGDNANIADPMPGYATFDLGIRYAFRAFTLAFSVDNLLDKTYATYGYWYAYSGSSHYSLYPANGRTARISLTYSF